MTPTSTSEGNGFPTQEFHSNGANSNGANVRTMTPFSPSFATPLFTGTGAKAKPSGLRHTLEILFRHRKIALSTFLAVIALAVVTTWSTRRVYQATATLLVNTAPLGGGTGKDSSIGDVEGVNQTRKIGTVMEVLRTSAIMKGAIDRIGPNDREALRELSGVDITPVRNTDLLTVAARSYSSEAAAALANAICASYIDQSQKSNREEVAAQARYVKQQLQTVTLKLDKARDTLKNFQERNGISDMAAQATAVTGELAQIRGDLRQSRTERASVAAQIGALQSAAARIAPFIISSTTTPRASYLALRAQLTRLQLDRITALSKFQPTSQRVRDIDSQIERVQQRLASEAPTEVSGQQKNPNPPFTAVQEELARAQTQVRSLDARAIALQASLTRAEQELALLPQKTSRFGQLSADVVALEGNYRQLDQEYQALSINEQARLANARTVSVARPPGAPIGSSRARTLLMAAVIGAILAYALALAFEKLDQKIHSSQDAENAAQLPVMIDVPFIRHREDQTILGGSGSHALRESFEMLGTQLRLLSRTTPVHTVVVTSSLPGEGKSMSTVNLAIAAALSGQRVVIMDCDLRQPSLHHFFGVANERGVSDVMSGACTWKDALQATGVRGLQILSSGSFADNPLELLSSHLAQACLDELAQSFDLVIIDTPPALLIADAAMLSTMTDATILVVSCNEVAQPEVQRATQSLAQTGAFLPGIILTKVVPLPGTHRDYGGYSQHRNARQNGHANGLHLDAPLQQNPVPSAEVPSAQQVSSAQNETGAETANPVTLVKVQGEPPTSPQ